MKQTQIEQVAKHLEKHGSITSWEAIMNYRATRLSAIIFILRKRGMQIATDLVTKDGSTFAVYRLESEE